MRLLFALAIPAITEASTLPVYGQMVVEYREEEPGKYVGDSFTLLCIKDGDIMGRHNDVDFESLKGGSMKAETGERTKDMLQADFKASQGRDACTNQAAAKPEYYENAELLKVHIDQSEGPVNILCYWQRGPDEWFSSPIPVKENAQQLVIPQDQVWTFDSDRAATMCQQLAVQ